MRHTLFNSPRWHRLLAPLASWLLRRWGWRLVGELPTVPRYVLIAAPHTSNWDFLLMLLGVLETGLDLHWMGKHSLFRAPFGGLMRWLGGIAIDRTRAGNVVAAMVEKFQQRDQLVLLITPEGTRSQVARWKTGFYQIACAADVPILMVYVDGERRELGLGPLFHPTGDIEKDLPEIQAFYAGFHGMKPRRST